MKVIILKFDDLNIKTHECHNWNGVFEYVISNKIKASAGVIGCSLIRNNLKYFRWIKAANDSKTIEIWNHGFNHSKKSKDLIEFCGTTYEEQYNSIKATQSLGKEKLGITFSTFGAPWNKIDNNTADVLKNFPDIKVWFSGDTDLKSIYSLKISKRYERYISNSPDPKLSSFDFTFDSFLEKYDDLILPYEVLQFHPSGWKNKNTLMEFYKIMEFLRNSPNVKFMTPSEYVAAKKVN